MMTVEDYFGSPEANRPMELLYGVVHEPPSRFYSHQAVVTRLTGLLDEHVRRWQLGRVCVSPMDVVLDQSKALVLQPDLMFVSNDRLGIIQDHIWGAPDLTIELMSPGTARHDRTVKIESYRRYQVRECWLADPASRVVEVFSFEATPPAAAERFAGAAQIRSRVLPLLSLPVDSLFDV